MRLLLLFILLFVVVNSSTADLDIYNDYEFVVYEPFSGGSGNGGQIGKHGWTPSTSGGGGVNFSNAPNHWGTVNLETTALAGSIQSIFISASLNPNHATLPALNATSGWTNRIIWRLNGTNSCRAWIALHGGVGEGTAAGSGLHNIGIFVNTTNTDQVMGYCNTTSLALNTSVNLGTLVSGQWNTNEWWCASAGTISFSMNGGAESTIASNVPTVPLQHVAAIMKVVNSDVNVLEIDEWRTVKAR